MLNLGPGVSVPAAGTASSSAVRRLQKDYAKLMQDPVDGIKALPNEDNILEWHYCLRGSPDTPFYGGYYWGKVIFKENFPWSPPAITMITPNGRFQTNTRLCLSISDYHPESWNPGWTVSAILIGLHSFMNENSPAAGSIAGTPQDQRMYAAASKEFNVKYREFRRFFPQFVKDWTGVLPTPNEPNIAPTMLPEHASPTTGGAPNAAPNAPIVRGFGFDNNLPARFQQVLGRPIPIGGGGAPAPPPPPPAAAEAAEVGAPGAPQVLLERPGVRLMQGPPRFGRLGGGAARRAARAQAPLYQEQPNYRDLVELAAEQARQAAAAPPPQLVPMLRDPIPIRFHRRDELLDRFGMDLGVAHRQELLNERIELVEARDQLAEQQRRALEAQRDQLARHNALADDLRARRERIVQEARAHARDARLEAAAAADRRERFLQEAQEADARRAELAVVRARVEDGLQAQRRLQQQLQQEAERDLLLNARRAADGDARAELGEQLRALEAAVAGLPEAQAPQLRDRRARFVARLRARRAADAQAGALANEQRALEARLEADFADLRAAEGRLLHPPPPQNYYGA